MIAELLGEAHVAAREGRVAQAREALAQLDQYATNPSVASALGILHYLTGDALASARALSTLTLHEHTQETLMCYSAALTALGQERGALECQRLALALEPSSLGCVEDFFESWDLSRFHLPKLPVRRWGEHMRALARGDFESYGAALLEAARRTPAPCPGAVALRLRSGRSLALWTGNYVNRLAVLFVDGHGDAFCFGRYLRKLRLRVGTLLVLASRSALSIAARSGIDADFVALEDCAGELDRADAYAFEWLLPWQSGEAYGDACWLRPTVEHVERWRLDRGAALHAGIAWAGSSSNMWNGIRSLAAEELGPLLSVPWITWHSLQVGPEAAACPASFVDHAGELTDFHDTAALIANLDLVVSVDTAVANLAGAMGARLWVLCEPDPDFRWCGEGDTTPWFPSARIFQQNGSGWAGVLERVAAELRTINQTKETA